jgi:UDP-N-acetylmuramoylalanine--D-glutamate ligase
MGLGRNTGGAWSAIFAMQSGAKKIIATDLKDTEFNKPSVDLIEEFVQTEKPESEIKYVPGEHKEEDFKQADIVIKNPIIRRDNQFIQVAVQNGASITSDIALFLNEVKNTTAEIIAITGTKGKTSTAYLVDHVLRVAGFKTKTGGNTGISVLSILDLDFDGIYVLETSSFATEEMLREGMLPDYYLVTSLFHDHLNMYTSEMEYFKAKFDLIKTLNPQNVFVNITNPTILSVIELNDGYENINKVDCTDSSGLNFPDHFSYPLKENATLASRFLHQSFEISFDTTNNAVKSSTSPKNRFEILGAINIDGTSVEFINDAAASIPEASLFGLKTLVDQDKNIFLITGGSDKNLDFTELFKFINQHVSRVFLIKGGDLFDLFTVNIKSSLLEICEDSTEATKKALEQARKVSNSSVILSRGSTSFGVANNENEMGDDFKEIFKELKYKAGARTEKATKNL